MSHLLTLLTVAGEQRGYVTTRDAAFMAIPMMRLRCIMVRYHARSSKGMHVARARVT